MRTLSLASMMLSHLELAATKSPQLIEEEEKERGIKIRKAVTEIDIPNAFLGKTKKPNKGISIGSYKYRSR